MIYGFDYCLCLSGLTNLYSILYAMVIQKFMIYIHFTISKNVYNESHTHIHTDGMVVIYRPTNFITAGGSAEVE